MKYTLENGERQLLSTMQVQLLTGASLLSPPEVGRLYLTNRRLVFTTSTGVAAVLLGRLIDAFFPSLQDILYQISLDDIAHIKTENRKYAGFQRLCLVITIKSGEEFIFFVGNIYKPQAEKWANCISTACRESRNNF